MKWTLPLLLFTCAAVVGRAEGLCERYASYGHLVMTQLVSAPFPHPKRAEGHTYKGTPYPAKAHYSDGTVAIFVPKGYRETGRLDFVVHFHGWHNHVEAVLGQYRLIEQLVESKRNAVLVVPQGPRDAPDSFGGKLEDRDGFKRFMAEVMDTLRWQPVITNKDVALGDIILSGHSGGYKVISSILDCGGLTPQVKEVWLFDALYGQTDKFLAWLDQQHGRMVNIYTEHGGTKEESLQMMDLLRKRGTPFVAGNETAVAPTEFQARQPIFLFTTLEHNDVVAKHDTFRDFLKTSCLEACR